MDRIFEYVIPSGYDNASALRVLKEKYKMSSKLIKELKKTEDGLLLNGEHIRTVDTVCAGDTLRITLHDKASQSIKPVNIPINIVYEDEDILVVDKDAYMPTHPSMGNYENSVANAVMYYYYSKGEERTFRAVNRLDKYTSGLMTIAKNAYIHAALAAEVQRGELQRKYKCIVSGDIEGGGIIDLPIERAPGSTIMRMVSETGQKAVTRYKVIESLGGYTLLEMLLETGRTHQIRVHMSHIGHPLAGDWLYGGENSELVSRQMLHSYYLRLIHPVTGREMEFWSEPAPDMAEFIKKLRENMNGL